MPSTLLKCAVQRIKDFTFSSNIYATEDRKKTPRIKVSFVLTSLITCGLCFLFLFAEHLLIHVFFFRSRSYPVPHRGERVKQRKMHARNWANYENSCKILSLNMFSSLLHVFVHFLSGFKMVFIFYFFPINFVHSSVCRSCCVELTVHWFQIELTFISFKITHI